MATMKVGIDNGNVLCESDTDYIRKGDLSAAREIPGGFDTLTRLVQVNGADNIWIVSKCGQKVQDLSWQWFKQHKLFERTGLTPTRYNLPPDYLTMDPEHLHWLLTSHRTVFCQDRIDKAFIAESLGLEAFVDDRLQILGSLPPYVKIRILFRPKPQEVKRHQHLLDDRIHIVHSWTEAAPFLGL